MRHEPFIAGSPTDLEFKCIFFPLSIQWDCFTPTVQDKKSTDKEIFARLAWNCFQYFGPNY